MSKFLKALEQAERDRALLDQARVRSMPLATPSPTAPPAPAPVRSLGRRETEPIAVGRVAEHLVSLVAPASFEAEQYQTLRHIVEQAHRTRDITVLAVSSPATGDGKTTTAINLAGALAQSPDAKVLLVDADLRHPAVANGLGLGHANLPGLVDATVDAATTLRHAVRFLAPFNLSLLVAGRPSTSPYELLKSPRLAELLAQARREYDYVVLDTPPLVGLPDCRVVAKHVDAFLLVVTAHKTPRRFLEAALGALDPASILGLVLNGDDDSPSAEYGRYAQAVRDSRHPHGGGSAARGPSPRLQRRTPPPETPSA